MFNVDLTRGFCRGWSNVQVISTKTQRSFLCLIPCFLFSLNHWVHSNYRLWHYITNKISTSCTLFPMFIQFALDLIKNFPESEWSFLDLLIYSRLRHDFSIDSVMLFQSSIHAFSSFSLICPRIHFLVSISVLIKSFAKLSIPFLIKKSVLSVTIWGFVLFIKYARSFPCYQARAGKSHLHRIPKLRLIPSRPKLKSIDWNHSEPRISFLTRPSISSDMHSSRRLRSVITFTI
jgi:hypothetical protein